MYHLGYVPCKANGDLWIKMEQRPDDGLWYYSYVLFYVDHCRLVHKLLDDIESKVRSRRLVPIPPLEEWLDAVNRVSVPTQLDKYYGNACD